MSKVEAKSPPSPGMQPEQEAPPASDAAASGRAPHPDPRDLLTVLSGSSHSPADWQSIKRQAIDALTRHLRHRNETVRRFNSHKIVSLLILHPELADDILTPLLRHRSPAEPQTALTLIAENAHHHPGLANRDLIAEMTRHPDSKTAVQAVDTLYAVRDPHQPEKTIELLRPLQDSPHPAVRVRSLGLRWAEGDRSDPVGFLTEFKRHILPKPLMPYGPHNTNALECISGMCRPNLPPDFYPALYEVERMLDEMANLPRTQETEYTRTLAQAAESLSQFRKHYEFSPGLLSEELDYAAWIRSDSLKEQAEAVKALEERSNPGRQWAEALQWALANPGEPFLKFVWGKTRQHGVQARILALLDKIIPDEGERAGIFHPFLAHPSRRLRTQAAASLRRIAAALPEAPARAIAAHLAHSKTEVVEAALSILALTAPPPAESVPHLVRLFAVNRHRWTVLSAVNAFHAPLPEPLIRHVLLPCLNSGTPDEQIRAAQILGREAGSEPVEKHMTDWSLQRIASISLMDPPYDEPDLRLLEQAYDWLARLASRKPDGIPVHQRSAAVEKAKTVLFEPKMQAPISLQAKLALFLAHAGCRAEVTEWLEIRLEGRRPQKTQTPLSPLERARTPRPDNEFRDALALLEDLGADALPFLPLMEQTLHRISKLSDKASDQVLLASVMIRVLHRTGRASPVSAMPAHDGGGPLNQLASDSPTGPVNASPRRAEVIQPASGSNHDPHARMQLDLKAGLTQIGSRTPLHQPAFGIRIFEDGPLARQIKPALIDRHAGPTPPSHRINSSRPPIESRITCRTPRATRGARNPQFSRGRATFSRFSR